jgi:hypothetical protein
MCNYRRDITLVHIFNPPVEGTPRLFVNKVSLGIVGLELVLSRVVMASMQAKVIGMYYVEASDSHFSSTDGFSASSAH